MPDSIINQTLLNQYRVDAFIASGGMGTVYRVWDLKRNVPLAMKVLHSDLAEDPHMFKRFKREANALKKLTHPNIVQFYGLFQTLDFAFLLEGFIDGPSLKDILRQRGGTPLPVQEALTYLKALSSALGYAHANRVVHCDVKPGNILVDQVGNIYLTDFGIARHSDSTTTTMVGAGTAAYMAPEQIRGEAVVPATDVYALGVMLFEMLTGQRPFRGNEAGTESGGVTANERIRYAHLHLDAPDPRSLNPSIPQELAQTIQKALDKDPAGRYQSMQGFTNAVYIASRITFSQVTDRIVLPSQFQETIQTAQPPDQPIPPSQPIVNRKMLPWLIGGGAFLMIVLVFSFAGGRPQPGLQLTQAAEAIQELTSPARAEANQSSTKQPDTPVPGKTHIPIPTSTPNFETNPIDGAYLVPIPADEFIMGIDPANNPYFMGAESPSQKIYLDEFSIYRTEVTNSMYEDCVAEQACPRPENYSSRTAQSYYDNPKFADYPVINVTWVGAQSYCVWAGGRLPTEAEWEKASHGVDSRFFPWGDTPPYNEQINICDSYCADVANRTSYIDNYPDIAPVGVHPQGASPYGVLDMSGNVWEWVLDWSKPAYISPEYENPKGPASGTRRVIRGGSWRNVPSEVTTVVRLSMKPDDVLDTLGFRCVIEPSAEQVHNPTETPNSSNQTGPGGKIVYTCQINRNEKSDQICIMNADGSNQRQLTQNSFENYYPSLAPDGKSVVFASNQTGNFEIYEMDLNGNQQRLTSGIGELSAPEISPNGTRIVFTNNSSQIARIWLMKRNGDNAREVYFKPGIDALDPTWAPDGDHLLFAVGSPTGRQLYTMSVDGSGLNLVSKSFYTRGRSDWSPDGDTIATYSGESWHREIYLLNLDGSDPQQISSGGNVLAPSFSPDGQWITFTGYIDNYGNDDGCEIYIMRIDGSDVRRLTDNNYCDWQPRWGS